MKDIISVYPISGNLFKLEFFLIKFNKKSNAKILLILNYHIRQTMNENESLLRSTY